MIFGIMGMGVGMGCDFCWADCLSQDLQDFGDEGMGRMAGEGLANCRSSSFIPIRFAGRR